MKVHIFIQSPTLWDLKLHPPYSRELFRSLSYFYMTLSFGLHFDFHPSCAKRSFQHSFSEISALKNINGFVTDIFRGKKSFYQKAPWLAGKQSQKSCCFQSPKLYTILKNSYFYQVKSVPTLTAKYAVKGQPH